MNREFAFRDFLRRNKKPAKYVGYCKKIEKACGNMDMDEIISSHQNIGKVRANLDKAYTNPGSNDDYMVALNWYLVFSVSASITATAATSTGAAKTASKAAPKKSSAVAPAPRVFSKGPIVQYYTDVPPVEQDEVLREELEQEYPQILQYAANILRPFVNGNTLPYIPVYLSKETPQQEYAASRSYLNKLKKKEEEDKELSDAERAILRTGKIKQRILGRFFPGVEPHIEIYYRHLPSGLVVERIAAAVKCLAHEYMHFLHYRYATEHGVADPFENEKLGEALADCFGVLYSYHKGGREDLAVAKNRYARWRERKNSGWPYAYAIYCFPKRHKSRLDLYSAGDITKTEDKLKVIFGATTDAKAAFAALTH